MIRNYCKIAWRNIVRNKTFSVINISGLAIGMASTMNSWLLGYHYRIEINWLTFVLAGGMAIIIALLTISYQAIKAALANPVKSLRTE